MLLPRLLLLLCAPLFALESGWNTVWSPHFIIHQEISGPKRAAGADLEKVFRVLHKDLWTLSSWMDTEKVEVYLYKDKKSYQGGRFKPPAWSGGMVHHSGQPGSAWSLAIYEPLDKRIAAHELTHLYFRSFFKNSAGRIPLWLNEGLAEMMAEEAAGSGRVPASGPAVKKPSPLKDFLALRQVPDGASGEFYPQAHSLVRFLKKANSPLKCEKFCRQLRDGEQPGRAMFSAYGFMTTADLESAWKKWAARPAP